MVITRTPFRVSFFGGGTDYPDFFCRHGGAVLSTTIDRYCFVTVRQMPSFFEFRNQFTYSKIERFNTPDTVSHPLVRETLKKLHEDKLQISYDADLPARTGIGSSSAFAVGLLHAVHALRGHVTTAFDLATEAIHVERDLCQECGGIQDQIAVAYGGFNRIDFDQNGFHVRPFAVSSSRLNALQRKLMLFYSGQSRLSFRSARAQNDNLSKNTTALLRMKQMVDEAETILAGTDSLDAFGTLLAASWQLKASLASEISTPEIETMYAAARNAGAIGGKLLGAGGGGFLLLYVPEDNQEQVSKALNRYQSVPFRFESEGTKILYRSPSE